MFKEIIKFIPKLDQSDLAKMDRQLSTRFAKVAKKFGKGLAGILAGGAVLGAITTIVDKLINPLKAVDDALNATISRADDTVTNAKQFESSAGKLFKLEKFGEAAGLDREALSMLINKFANTVAEAKADPNKDTSVRKYVGQPDMVEGFFNFIQALQKMEKSQQLLVQQEVFGEKQILKMSDFLNSDFAQLSKQLKLRPAADYDAALGKQANQNDLKDILEARRTAEDTYKKAQIITNKMIEAQARRAERELQEENRRIQSYHSLAMVQEASAKILNLIEQGFLELADAAQDLGTIRNFIQKFSGSRVVKGIKKAGD